MSTPEQTLAAGTDRVAFNLAPDTASRIVNPRDFLVAWDRVVEVLTQLTGRMPSSHSGRGSTRLTFQEISAANDADLQPDRFAVWSPSAGVIKLGSNYSGAFTRASLFGPLVVELAEAVGLAALSYQQQTATSLYPQVLCWDPVAPAMGRALGLYALFRAGRDLSSIQLAESGLTASQVLYRDNLLASRKYRLGVTGDGYLESPVPADNRDSGTFLGFLLDLFTVYGRWDFLEGLIREIVPKGLERSDAFTRPATQQYDDLVLALSRMAQAHIGPVLRTWGFSRFDSLAAVSATYPRLGTTQPMVLSERFRNLIDPQLADRETAALDLPAIGLGGQDNFAMTQSSAPVLVLVDPEPVDGKSYRGLRAELLGTRETDGSRKYVTLQANYREDGPLEVVVVPLDPEHWPVGVTLEPGSGQQLVVGRILHLGLVNPPEHCDMPVMRLDGAVRTSRQERVGQIHYAVFALEDGSHTYVRQAGQDLAQTLVVEFIPQEHYEDPVDSTPTDNPGGWTIRTYNLVTSADRDGVVSRTFVTESKLVKNDGEEIGTLFQSIPATLDATLQGLRERPVTEGRPQVNYLAAVPNPILAERVGFLTRRTTADLARVNEVEIRLDGTVPPDTAKILRDQLPHRPVQVFNLSPAAQYAIRETLTQFPAGSGAVTTDERNLALSDAFRRHIPPAQLDSILKTARAPTGVTLIPGLTKDELTAFNEAISAVALSAADQRDRAKNDEGGQVQAFSVAQARALEDRIRATVGTPNYLRDFLANGFAGATQTADNPQNPLSHLDGSFLTNLIGSTSVSVDSAGPQVTLVDFGRNPRAASGVIGSLLGAGIAASGLEALVPGLGSQLKQSVQDNLTALALGDKLPSDAQIDIIRDMGQAVAAKLFQNDPVALSVAGKLGDMLAGFAKDVARGKMMAHTVEDALSVRLNGTNLKLGGMKTWHPSETLPDAAEQNIDVLLGEAELTRQLADPKLIKVLQIPLGESTVDTVEFDTGTGQTQVVVPPTDHGTRALLKFGKDSLGMQMSFLDVLGSGRERAEELKRAQAELIKVERINAASRQNLRSYFVKTAAVHHALSLDGIMDQLYFQFASYKHKLKENERSRAENERTKANDAAAEARSKANMWDELDKLDEEATALNNQVAFLEGELTELRKELAEWEEKITSGPNSALEAEAEQSISGLAHLSLTETDGLVSPEYIKRQALINKLEQAILQWEAEKAAAWQRLKDVVSARATKAGGLGHRLSPIGTLTAGEPGLVAWENEKKFINDNLDKAKAARTVANDKLDKAKKLVGDLERDTIRLQDWHNLTAHEKTVELQGLIAEGSDKLFNEAPDYKQRLLFTGGQEYTVWKAPLAGLDPEANPNKALVGFWSFLQQEPSARTLYQPRGNTTSVNMSHLVAEQFGNTAVRNSDGSPKLDSDGNPVAWGYQLTLFDAYKAYTPQAKKSTKQILEAVAISAAAENKKGAATSALTLPGMRDQGVERTPSAGPLPDRISSVVSLKPARGSKRRPYVFEVMPAVRSVAQTQGMQAPGADRGIQFRTSLNVAKINVPGSQPVYQVMGISEEYIEFVGAFLGMRSHNQMTGMGDLAKNGGASSRLEEFFGPAQSSWQYNRAWQESQEVRDLLISGETLKLGVYSYAGMNQIPTGGSDRSGQEGIGLEVEGYVIAFERHIQRDDRVWYRIVFRVTKHGVAQAAPRRIGIAVSETILSDQRVQFGGLMNPAQRAEARQAAGGLGRPDPFAPVEGMPTGGVVFPGAPVATGAVGINPAILEERNNRGKVAPPTTAADPKGPSGFGGLSNAEVAAEVARTRRGIQDKMRQRGITNNPSPPGPPEVVVRGQKTKSQPKVTRQADGGIVVPKGAVQVQRYDRVFSGGKYIYKPAPNGKWVKIRSNNEETYVPYNPGGN